MNHHYYRLLALSIVASLYTQPHASDIKPTDTLREVVSEHVAKLITDARLSIGVRNFSEAMESLSEIIGSDSTNSEALFWRAQVSLAIKDLPNALIDIDRALKYDESNANIHVVRSKINSRIGNHSQAAIDCSKLIALRDWDPDHYFRRAQHYVLSGQIELALVDYEKYYESIPIDNERRQDEIRKTLKVLRRPYGPTVFAEAWKVGREVYLAWERQDWAAMAERVTRGDLKKFKSRMVLAARAQGSIDFDYFKIDGVMYKKSEIFNMAPQEYFEFQMRLFSREQSPWNKVFTIRYLDVFELIPRGKKKAQLRSSLYLGPPETAVNLVFQDEVKLEDDIWKLRLPRLFQQVTDTIKYTALGWN